MAVDTPVVNIVTVEYKGPLVRFDIPLIDGRLAPEALDGAYETVDENRVDLLGRHPAGDCLVLSPALIAIVGKDVELHLAADIVGKQSLLGLRRDDDVTVAAGHGDTRTAKPVDSDLIPGGVFENGEVQRRYVGRDDDTSAVGPGPCRAFDVRVFIQIIVAHPPRQSAQARSDRNRDRQ